MNQTFRDRGNAGQLLDFSLLTYNQKLERDKNGKLSPTDIDGVFELHSTASRPLRRNGVVFLEFKCRGVMMGMGQQIMYEHLCDGLAASGLIARTLEVRHYVYDADEDINAGACEVYRIYDGTARTWAYPTEPVTVSEYIDEFINECKG